MTFQLNTFRGVETKQTVVSIESTATDWNCLPKLIADLNSNTLIKTYKETHEDKLISQFILELPVIQSNKLQSTAGKAVLSSDRGPHMRLHSALFDTRDELKDQRLETFFHEIAHFIAYFTKHDIGHGIYWQYCMIHFGYKPKRCYDGTVLNFRGYGKRKEIREIYDIIETLPEFEL